MKYGLILEGGAMRGMFTAGVLDIFMENGITVDGMVGVSAGTVFGCNYKSKQIGRTIRYNAKYCNDPRYCSIRSLIKTGDLYGNAFCYHEIPEKLDLFDIDTFAKNPMAFYATCTDVDTGKAVYHRIDHIDDTEMDWMRASASMPLVSTPVAIDGKRYLDGGIADSIPLRFFERIGYEKNIVILTRPKGYIKRQSRSTILMKAALHKMPRLVEQMQMRPNHYNRALRYLAKRVAKGYALAIYPPYDLPVGHVEKDPNKLRETYRIGRETGASMLPAVKAFLENKEIQP